ncbi:short chain dehydrogenase family protein [Burkholderia pseudomallei MSHR449]|nr:short chain dehydrogenase family protein [Burkholderia pseudomallei MSHR449]
MTGKRILVTGAGSGFGREVALRLAAKGHCVIAGVQIAPQITELSAEAARRGLALDAVKLDVTCARERAQAARWDVDVLLNNAGAGEAGALVDLPVDIVRELFETNVFGPLELTQQVARGMIARGRGRIVFVSSIAGLITGAYTGAYCASKHALEAIAEAMHLELAAHGVQIAVVNPGPYRTGFNDRMMETPRRWARPGARRGDARNAHVPARAVRSAGDDREDGRRDRGRRRAVPQSAARRRRADRARRAGARVDAPSERAARRVSSRRAAIATSRAARAEAGCAAPLVATDAEAAWPRRR